ncbi:hypothetical protein KEM09_08175 [Carboxylicivirga mesophila]|uniref:CarD-like/TRCF RNAP-interacting domain-containing protein n=1 Tax=Carboxylicivirga mesophila TaxID=1166478 RepID=A0ABS5KA25_9BACT|nr:hypothetical protein [Carboxylicivirga mesophila]MBS2211373.1 hypothetical protein [Carboxylicivirga mesophila]
MDTIDIKVGTRVEHPRYGEGIIARINLGAYIVFFEDGGKMEIPKTSTNLTIIESPDEGKPETVTARDLRQAIASVLDEYGTLPAEVELGQKWLGGKLLLQPANESLQAKEIPIETFFKKIVMLRDRLRVLEQNINSSATLNDEEKVHMQQYITRAYGSLTTFNVLFADKEDYFVGSGKK